MNIYGQNNVIDNGTIFVRLILIVITIFNTSVINGLILNWLYNTNTLKLINTWLMLIKMHLIMLFRVIWLTIIIVVEIRILCYPYCHLTFREY